ncbi:MAG: hypothetical protein M1816_003760 [Peltula sp. TS41687]|nr:MAG: hypothetical protein M1816_003760 [Peltula sp. TS41687]
MAHQDNDGDQFGLMKDVSAALQMMNLEGQSARRSTTTFEHNSAQSAPLRVPSRQFSWKSSRSISSGQGHSFLGGNEITETRTGPGDRLRQGQTALHLSQIGSTQSDTRATRPSGPRSLSSPTGLNTAHVFDHEIPAIGTPTSEKSNSLIRPRTADTADVEKQARTAFEGFDGVHYVDGGRRVLSERPRDDPFSSNPPSLAEADVSIERGVVHGNMVYYPAPVPMMLNMPQRLSKVPSAGLKEGRRSQAMDTMSFNASEGAGWRPQSSGGKGVNQANNGPERSPLRKSFDPRRSVVSLASLPPQLRASVFFEQAPISHEVVIREQSATATLESILDASEHAPVSAFTDHPFAGRIGPELHAATTGRGNSRDSATVDSHRRRSLASFSVLNSKPSRSSLAPRGIRSTSTSVLSRIELSTSEKSSSEFRVRDDLDDGQGDLGYGFGAVDDEDAHTLHPTENLGEAETEVRGTDQYVQPTTLMAELQVRKQQQKDRNKTAATAFPNGVHYSTLLELDRVAEVQKLSRKNKRIALAWEGPRAPEVELDEEVPLGILFPKKNVLDLDRPLGLLEKRDLEETEPLSRRRERLKGGTYRPNISRHTTALESAHQLDLRGTRWEGEAKHEADEDETLAQRARRLRAGVETNQDSIGKQLQPPLIKDVSSPPAVDGHPEEEAQVEETLAQRKQRLQHEHRSQTQGLHGRMPHYLRRGSSMEQHHSMANIQSEQTGGFDLQLPQSEPSLPISGPVHQTQQSLQACHNHLQLPRNNLFTELVYSRHSGISSSGGNLPGQNFVMNHVAFSRSLHDFSPPRSDVANAFRRSTTMGVSPGLPMDGAGTTFMSSRAAPLPESASLGAHQREIIDRWRLSVMP